MTTIKHKNNSSNIKCYRQFKLSEHKEKIQCVLIIVIDVIIIMEVAITQTTGAIMAVIDAIVVQTIAKILSPTVVLVEYAVQL